MAVERGSCITRSKSSSRSSSPASKHDGTLLPLPVQSSPRFAMRALLSHCFYRRVIIWVVTVTAVMCLMLFSGGVPTNQGRILDHLVDFGKSDLSKPSSDGIQAENTAVHHGIDSTAVVPEANEQETLIPADSNSQKTSQDNTAPQGLGSHPLHWLAYKQ